MLQAHSRWRAPAQWDTTGCALQWNHSLHCNIWGDCQTTGTEYSPRKVTSQKEKGHALLTMAHLELCTKAIENSLMKALVGLFGEVCKLSPLWLTGHIWHTSSYLSSHTKYCTGQRYQLCDSLQRNSWREELHAIYQTLVTEHNIWMYQTLHWSHTA